MDDQNQREIRVLFAGVILGAIVGAVAAYMLGTQGSAGLSGATGVAVACLTPIAVGAGALIGAFLASCLPAFTRGSPCWPCGAAIGAVVALVAAVVAGIEIGDTLFFVVVLAGAAAGAVLGEAWRAQRARGNGDESTDGADPPE